MRKLSFVIVGSGFRSKFFGRIAQTYPELFDLKYVLCRSEEKAQAITRETGFPTTTSIELCEACKPDFVIIAVNKANIADVAEEWAMKGIPVLTETPAGSDIEKLKRLWQLRTEHGCKIQVCEQYFHHPSLVPGLKTIEEGKIGETESMYLSLCHDYHGASLIRKYLRIGQELFTVSGQSFTYPLTETDSRQGAITDGRVADKQRDIALFRFESGKTALYDFSGEQYRSFIRSRHVTVRGRDGELSDQILYSMNEEHYPETQYLQPGLEPRYHALETKRLRDCVRFWKPELYLDEVEDEYAIACMLFDMADYVDHGREIYPLSDALQDAYMWQLLMEAVKCPGTVIKAEKMPWNE